MEDALSSEMATTWPPLGAGPVKVTVATELDPPTTEVGFNVNVDTAGAVTASGVATVNVPKEALMFAVTLFETAELFTTKVAEFEFAGISTDAGTVTAELSDATETADPPVGAGPDMVTVPVALLPPVTDVGETETLEMVGAVNVRVAIAVEEADEAVSVTGVSDGTAVVDTVNDAEFELPFTVTDAGTVAAALFDVRLTTVSEAAVPFRVTVPVNELPPTVVGDPRVTVDRVGASTV